MEELPANHVVSPGRVGAPRNAGTGQFAVGPGQRGKKRGNLNFMTIMRNAAKRTGHDLDTVVEIAMRGAVKEAAGGNVAAQKLVLDRLVGTVDNGTTVNVGIQVGGDGEPRTIGPPMPTGQKLVDYAAKFVQVCQNMHAFSGEEMKAATVRVVDHAAEVDELLDG